jgi:NAD(P)H-dependent flavin oxidoreductase YrpB (nitropropane dioxygenase family)
MWKQAILDREERQTLVGRGLFGPMRFLRNKRAEEIVEQTLEDLPNFYLGEPLESNEKILKLEQTGFDDLLDKKEDTALMFGGEVAGRIRDLPSTAELIEGIVREASDVLGRMPKFVVDR